MTETETNARKPYGEDQIVKMDILGMIHAAENPFDIIYHIARCLEKTSSERGYADEVRRHMRAVYGLAMGETKLLTDELKDVEARLSRLETSYATKDFSEEEKKRIGYAITLHKKNIERLKLLIRQAEIDHTSLSYEKK